jgi:hypothetical protein
MAVKANIVIDQGTDFEATIDLTSPDGLPYNLVGHSVASQMRKNYATATAAATFLASHNDAAGQITLILPKADTTDLEPGRYMYDVEITSSGGLVTRVVQGTATVTPGITRI